MDNTTACITAFLSDESGVTSIEYALMGALISTAIIVGAGFMAEQIEAMFGNVRDAVDAVLNG